MLTEHGNTPQAEHDFEEFGFVSISKQSIISPYQYGARPRFFPTANPSCFVMAASRGSAYRPPRNS
jgi:hypothetical protein